MKKVLFGLILGIGLAFTFSAQAEEIKSFVGAKIEGQFSVTVNGEVVGEPGIVINGVSYLPTRTIAELAGFNVAFDAGTGIELTKQIESESNSLEEVKLPEEVVESKEKIKERIRSIGGSIEMMQVSMGIVEGWRDKATDESKRQEYASQIEQHIEKIQELEQMKSDLEDQLAELVEQ